VFGAALASLVVLASSRNPLAQAAVATSDELKILNPAGTPLADIFITETPGPGTESSALYAPGAELPQVIGPGGLPPLVPPGGPFHYVILAEPPTEPVDPTELPPVFFGGGGPIGVLVSDLVISGRDPNNGQTFVAFISDNNPDLQAYVTAIPAGTPVLTIPETGNLQDVTVALGNPVFGETAVTVQVASDVAAPEQSTLVVVVLGAMPILIARRLRIC
jgi:hypothetical protein